MTLSRSQFSKAASAFDSSPKWVASRIFASTAGKLFGHEENNFYDRIEQFIEWSMKFAEKFKVYISVDTTAGPKYLTYEATNHELMLDNNNLNGSLPDSIAGLTNLEGLYLAGNNLAGSLPPGIGELVQLQHLGLANNQLSGLVPASITNLTNGFIDLRRNHLCARDPAMIEFLDMQAPEWLETQTNPICE